MSDGFTSSYDHPSRAGLVRQPGYGDDWEPPATADEVARDDADDLQESAMEAELGACTCVSWPDTAHSPGSVASIREGATDPECPLHGVEDFRA